MPAFNPNIAIGALAPIAQSNQTGRNAIIVRRAFDRIGDCSEADVGLACFGVGDRLLNIADFFAVIAPHQKHARLNAVRLTELNGVSDLLDRDSALHGVQNSLRSALRADPYSEAAELRQSCGNALS